MNNAAIYLKSPSLDQEIGPHSRTAGNPLQDTQPLCQRIMDRNLIRVRFQPIVSLAERSIIGLEALSYGLCPDTGTRVSPADLFSQAARLGITVTLDRHCRRLALESFGQTFAQTSDYLLWINLDPCIVDECPVRTGRLRDAVREVGLDPSRVVIEIIESHVSDVAALLNFVQVYHGFGFNLAVDDVGAGHSNLERLARIKPDIIKIDRFFIHDIPTEYHKQEAVRSLASLAQRIGALVVAEGIETESEALTLLDLGINLHQGFYYSHPDQAWPMQMESCRQKIGHVAREFRQRRLEKFGRRQAFFSVRGETVQRIGAELENAEERQFGQIMERAICREENLECLYVLDQDGIQVSETVCQTAKLRRVASPLFRPAAKGTDQSLKEYYLLIQAGLPRYISDPYISRATGNLGVTISQVFGTPDRRRFILCADYDL